MNEAGYISGTNLELKISENATNQSVLITGGSGNGKTVAMNKIAIKRGKKGQNILMFNYGGIHEKILCDEWYNVIKAKRDGIPIQMFEHFSSEYGGTEEDADVSEAVADVFSQVTKLGCDGRYSLEKACQKAIELRETCEDDMKCLYDGILLLKEDERKYLMAKYRSIFIRVKFHKRFELWRDEKATVIDLSGYPQSIQLILTQLVLSVLWRYHQVYGQQMITGTTVVLDEFHNFPLQDGSVITQILREGRKFNLSLLLATQTLSTYDAAKRTILQQPATRLYFKPVESELKRIAKQFPDIEAEYAERLLQNLRIGECLACGEFEIGGISKRRSMKAL